MITLDTCKKVSMVEMAYFHIWTAANESEREEIAKECGRITGEMIIHDIEQQYAEDSQNRRVQV